MTIRYFIHLLNRFLHLKDREQIELYYLLTNMKRNRDDNSSPTNKKEFNMSKISDKQIKEIVFSIAEEIEEIIAQGFDDVLDELSGDELSEDEADELYERYHSILIKELS